MPEKPEPQPRLKCPYCEAEITNIEIRAFGPGGIVTMFGCQSCLKPLPASIVPAVPDDHGASTERGKRIITP